MRGVPGRPRHPTASATWWWRPDGGNGACPARGRSAPGACTKAVVYLVGVLLEILFVLCLRTAGQPGGYVRCRGLGESRLNDFRLRPSVFSSPHPVFQQNILACSYVSHRASVALHPKMPGRLWSLALTVSSMH